ncbi:PREDICTED: sodium channel protein Nach [Drosophila arizonae]|uniref:Sodium channel protein Nach n=1 Tax=Drosophila arizonae TaxID=7263 RepID=A0ABM1NUJ7_DROAR|nr:PREDICTED: sodium channel protein Nach [Drosophila arizonae]
MGPVIKLSDCNDNANDNDDDKLPVRLKDKCFCIRRLTRIVLMFVAFGMTIYVCMLSSERYFQYWVQTTIDRTDVHVSEIAFPAITICPAHMTPSTLMNAREQRIILLYNLMQSIHWRTPMGHSTHLNTSEFEEFNNRSLLYPDPIFDFGYTCKDLFLECTWRRQEVDCCSLLFRRLQVGSCYVFNSVLVEDADPTWPWSVADSGLKSALSIKVNRFINGIRLTALGVIVQEPGQYVGSSVTYSTDDRIVVGLQPRHFTAEPAVRARPVNMRYCYFMDELKQSYSECIVRCHITYISRKCNCTHKLFPINIDQTHEEPMRQCTTADLLCMQKNGVSLFYMSNIIEESKDSVFNTTHCKCYPTCDHTQYHATTFTDRLSTADSRDNQFEIDVYFQEETLFSYRSTLHITMLDLMVSYGGIAGLFLGLSVVGAINSLLDRITCCSKPTSQPIKPDPEVKRASPAVTCNQKNMNE